MEDVLKKFNAEYKKCQVYTLQQVKGIKQWKDQVKFFRFDRDSALEVLKELVQEEKAKAEPIKASKIDDYGKSNRTLRSVLNTVNKYQAKVEEGCKELNQIPKLPDVNNASKKVEKLKKDIEADLKGRDKKDKSRPAIEKLLKQVEDDLKVADEFKRKINGIPKDYFDADKTYVTAIKNIMAAKAEMSSGTKKFNKLLKAELEKKNLAKTVKIHEKLRDTVKENADAAVEAARGNDKRGMEKHVQTGAKSLKELQKKTKPYLAIKKDFKQKIKEADESKLIVKGLKQIQEFLQESLAAWENAKVEIGKSSK